MRMAEVVVQAEPGRSFRLDWIDKADAGQESLRNAWLRNNPPKN
jgi:hypothetical protein